MSSDVAMSSDGLAVASSGAVASGADNSAAPARGAADRIARRILFVPDQASGQVYNIFSSSILLSATRCLLSYVVFPILAPWLSELPVIGPAVGVPIAVAALVFDVRAVRRFFLADHSRRWAATALYIVVIGMVSYLLVRDIMHLA
jgi:hypothetical protein